MTDMPLVGIPILNRLDHLERSLDCIDLDAQILIIDNNSVDRDFARKLNKLAEMQSLKVLHQGRNRGVAASWNLIVKAALEKQLDYAIIGSNDCFLYPRAVHRSIERHRQNAEAIWHIHAWNFFLFPTKLVEIVGWFDENFYPAYKEDQDYAYRCKLAGVQRLNTRQDGEMDGEHEGSQTIASDPEYSAHNVQTHFDWNTNHYKMKWGGDAEAEQFQRPYNRDDKDWRWWPDPGGSLAFRDWDKGRIRFPTPP